MNWSAIAAIFLALAVGLGAFGAHGLKSRLDPEMMDIYKNAQIGGAGGAAGPRPARRPVLRRLLDW